MKQMLGLALDVPSGWPSSAQPGVPGLGGPRTGGSLETPEGGLIPLGGEALWSYCFIASDDQL